MKQQDEENKDGTKKEVALVQTVRGNYEGFTKQEVIKVERQEKHRLRWETQARKTSRVW